MKLTIPNQIDPTNFTDGEKMFTSLMFLIANKYGWDHWYNMNAGDFKKIIFPEGATNPTLFGPRTETLREHFDFAQIDQHNYCIRFKKVRPINKGQGVGLVHHTISGLREIKIWCYLMGQWFGGNEIVSQSDNKIEYTSSRRSATHLEYKNFLVG